MYCCPNCFNDSFLRNEIDAKSSTKGKCSFCLNNDVPIIVPSVLRDLFNPVLDIYEESESGVSLFEQIQNDWNIFLLEEKNQEELLNNITGFNKRSTYKPIYEREKQNIEQWESFREELKHNNRFFPDNAPTIDTIRPFGKYIGKIFNKRGFHFYRARINNVNEPIDIAQMGKPPAKKSTNRRANPIGIPYLYVASTSETAIAEIRGYKNETISVAKFEIVENLELADLRDPRTTVTPFGIDDEELELIYTNLPFLELLGDELSKPIIPSETNLEYLPSQYLSEIFKHIGFHGIIYRSSVSSGDNYVLFDDNKVKAVEVNQYQITDIITRSTPL